MVESKLLTYHRTTAGEAVRFVIEGPTRVKVLTRLRVPNSAASMDYAVEVVRDGALLTVKEMNTESDGPNSTYLALEMFTPGKLKRFYIDVPTGRHAYNLLAAGGVTVDVRVFEAADRAPKRVSLAPREYAGVETLLSRDKELTYYLATGSDPVVLELIGPTTVKVNVRLIFETDMLGDQGYMLGVRSWAGGLDESPRGADEIVYRFESKASETITCRDRGDVLPGALRSFELPVPVGRQTYVFRLAGGQGREMALKFYIPRGDVANEP
ncbi:hypothetical protein K8S17_02930 [bacterium]|nr:hypothetical protein [bacterium]